MRPLLCFFYVIGIERIYVFSTDTTQNGNIINRNRLVVLGVAFSARMLYLLLSVVALNEFIHNRVSNRIRTVSAAIFIKHLDRLVHIEIG